MIIVNENLEDFQNDMTNEDLKSILKEVDFSEDPSFKEFRGPFATRFEIYQLLSILSATPEKPREIAKIVFVYDKFVEFWNKSMKRISLAIHRMQKYKIEKLQVHFDRIVSRFANDIEYEKFEEKYLDRGGCFSLTKVKLRGGEKKDLLCFSGLDNYNHFNEIQTAIKIIKDKGKFINPELIPVSDNIKYYMSDKKYITYGEAKKSHLKYEYRMFTCCERKTFAAYSFKNCKSYLMLVKYVPCLLCISSVRRHRTKYNGKIIWGRCQRSSPRKLDFNSYAEDIYNYTKGSKKRKNNP